MTPADKKLIYIALCEYFPHGVKVSCGDDIAMTLRNIDENCFCDAWENEDVKVHSRWMLPYLRPMSSMTDEEKEEFENLLEGIVDGIERWDKPDLCEEYDWLTERKFDYRGLIEKGLALPAPEGMYKKESE